jgi:hypothetical protein
VHIAATIDDKSRELVDFFAGLDRSDLRTACADPNGATVAAVLEHLDEGYDQALGWLRLAAAGALPAAGPPAVPAPADHGHDHPHPHEHPHPHDHEHPHDHDHGGSDVAAATEHLRRGGEVWAEMVRGFTPEQLDLVPPATPGITDGTRSLGDILVDLLDHQMAHLAYARQAVADRAETVGQPQ